MTGPKRGIDLTETVLIEYDVRIKTGDREEDDQQLIDGASLLDPLIHTVNQWHVAYMEIIAQLT